ncbi:MAG: chemotaxis protein CheB [Thermoleophilia bacterium]|nr:chemotaxis protein CheB [Thermoleophilia bacterium]
MSTDASPARVIGIGASAGGLEALVRVVQCLPADFAGAICIVLHVPAMGRNLLASILARRAEVPIETARHGEPLAAGHVYVAPSDRHLLVNEGKLELSRGPKENGVRPAVDPLLRSVAGYRERGVAVVLSGTLGDGSAGAAAVARAGGVVIVQDSADALFPSMPETALGAVGPRAHVLEAPEIGKLLVKLSAETPQTRDNAVVTLPDEDPAYQRPEGPATGFTCPECSGAIWEVRDGDLVRYRCRVGHAYSEDAFVNGQRDSVEAAMWAALEMLEERVELLRRIADRHGSSNPRTRKRLQDTAESTLERAELIRRALRADAEPPDLLDREVAPKAD